MERLLRGARRRRSSTLPEEESNRRVSTTSSASSSPASGTRTRLRSPSATTTPRGLLFDEELPEAVVVAILSFLPMRDRLRCARVCKRWSTLVRERMNVWELICMTPWGASLTDEELATVLVSYGRACRDLQLGSCMSVSSELLGSLPQLCPDLERLDLTGMVQAVDDDLLMRLADPFSDGKPWRLQRLILDHCIQVTDVGVRALAANGQDLVELGLENCPFVTDTSLLALPACTRLVTLDLTKTSTTDRGLASLLPACTQLRRLHVRECRGITNVSVELIARCIPRLKHIDLSLNPGVTNVEVLANSCHELEWIALCGCEGVQDESVEALGRYCPQIRHLALANCTQLSDTALRAIGQGLRHLRGLYLDYCGGYTDDGVQMVTKGCKRLRVLSMQFCEDLSGRGVGGMYLRDLLLAGSREVDDAGLVFIAEHAPNLRTLSLAGCRQVTDVGVIALMRSCHFLERLDVSHVVRVTERAIGEVARNGTHLVWLDVSGTDIPSHGVKKLVELCLALKELRLFGCTRVSAKMVQRAREHGLLVRTPSFGADPDAL